MALGTRYFTEHLLHSFPDFCFYPLVFFTGSSEGDNVFA